MVELVHIRGAKEMEAVLKQLPEYIAVRVARNAVRAAANVVLEEARRTAPVGQEAKGRVRVRTTKKGKVVISQYGKLKLSLNTRVSKTEGHRVTVFVGVGNAFWGMFQEFGTSKMRARPWFRPAFDTSWREALDVMGKKLGDGIETAAKKLAGPLRRSGLK